MKRFLMTTALVAVGTTGAIAQDADERFRADNADAIYASDFIGMRVYSTEAQAEGEVAGYEGVQDNWEDIGEINDIVLTREGNVDAVLVDIGGFLGIGERQIAVKMNALDMASDESTPDDPNDFFLVLNAAAADLENAPQYEYDREGMMSGSADQTAAVDTETEVKQNAEEMASDAGQAVDNAAESTEQAAENAGEAIENTAEDTAQAVDNAAEETGEAVENAAAETEQAAENATEETAEAVDEGTNDAAMNSDTAAVTETAPAADMAEGEQALDREGYQTVDANNVTTEELTGARVYDAKNEWIGEISELLVNGEEKIDRAVIDVGGFLGIGEKPVAVSTEDLDIQRPAEGGNIVVSVKLTKEQLEGMQTYEKQ